MRWYQWASFEGDAGRREDWLTGDKLHMLEHEGWTVVDLFSGAGGASYGFHAHPGFRIAGAADAQKGKPSSGTGKLQLQVLRAHHPLRTADRRNYKL